jgi:site-specific recombinase XerD
MGETEISLYISYLASVGNVAASTQNQALNAIVFLYKQVLKIDLGDFGPMERAKRPKRLPTVLTKAEVSRILNVMRGAPRSNGEVNLWLRPPRYGMRSHPC